MDGEEGEEEGFSLMDELNDRRRFIVFLMEGRE